MNIRRLTQTIIPLTVLLSHPMLGSVQEYRLTVGGDSLVFAPQPDLGYVVQTRQKAGGISILSNTLGFLASERARPIRGLDRHGIWVVEDKRPAVENEETIRLLGSEAQVTYAAPLFSCQGEIVAIIPEIVVRVTPRTNLAELQHFCESVGCGIKKQMEFTEQEYLLEVLGLDAGSVFAAVEALGQSAAIEWACPNFAFQPGPCGQSDSLGGYAAPLHPRNTMVTSGTPGAFPNDEYFSKQWHLHNTGQSGGTPGADIRAPEAWEITTGDPNIVVAVFDSGVDLDHPDLVNNLVPGYDFYQHDDVPEPSKAEALQAHGTACAGLIAAQGDNVIGVTGVTWHCGLMPIRAYVWGNWGATPQSDVATALRWAAAHGADVLSNSWVENTPVPIVRSAIVDVTKSGGIGRDGNGCIVLFASGNESGAVLWPARYAEVIAVGATDKTDGLLSYSSRGPELDLVAPSGILSGPGSRKGEIWTTDVLGLWGNRDPKVLDYTDSFSGTSAACPIAAGVAALILSIEPNLTSDEVRHFLERSAKDLGDPGRDDSYGWGRVDARAALDMVLAKRADLNNDWILDEKDLVVLRAAMETGDLSADIAPAAKRDGVVDANDLALLMQYLGTEIPELGLVAHWKLDETEGVVAHDSAGKNDATIMGIPLWQPEGGMIGGALQLGGVPDSATARVVRNPSEGELSVFAWVKWGVPGQVVVSQREGVNWLMADPAAGALMTELQSGGRNSKALYSDAVIADGDWHRVGFTWDGQTRVLYVDDIEAAWDTQSSLASCSGDLNIGCGKDMAPSTFWSGLIDDVRIYDRAVKP